MHAMHRHGRLVLSWLGCVLIAAVLCLPWAAERAIEGARFEDRLGTLPVEVGLAHNGYTTLDTGLLGKVYWRRTAPSGFGALVRSTGPPLADGTLASYVSPAFVRANARFLDDPDGVAVVYGAELRRLTHDGLTPAASDCRGFLRRTLTRWCSKRQKTATEVGRSGASCGTGAPISMLRHGPLQGLRRQADLPVRS